MCITGPPLSCQHRTVCASNFKEVATCITQPPLFSKHLKINATSMHKWSEAINDEVTVHRKWTQQMLDNGKENRDRKQKGKAMQKTSQGSRHVVSLDSVHWHDKLHIGPGFVPSPSKGQLMLQQQLLQKHQPKQRPVKKTASTHEIEEARKLALMTCSLMREKLVEDPVQKNRKNPLPSTVPPASEPDGCMAFLTCISSVLVEAPRNAQKRLQLWMIANL
eukprot:gnl/MRDRNA2_/MRDRNA2_42707_c0_seq2.p1 gnl/MRDRNA2_/MRDRNA2_42707_c0~~gnl/MRDRNA2_/MRDRNA2_42707_c0_seq2.p1  ORF type:complete len:220 (-),score=47.92 gnl/MRDRNA2_/MRDRNA2_42707_c0_seq2:750-1409(-)